MRRLSILFSLLSFLAVTPILDAKNGNNGNGKYKAKHEWKHRANGDWRDNAYRDRYVRNRDWDRDRDWERYGRDRYYDGDGWARRTEGHRPHDLNGDGLITRNEWPGNNNSFRQLDRNGDGVISRYDRALRSNSDNIHRWRRR